MSPARPRPPAAAVDFYLHLRALVSPASLRRRPGAAREPEPLPPPAGGKRGEADEHPGADSAAPRRHRVGSGGAERAEGREGGTAAAAPRPPHTLPLAHTAGGGTGRRNRGSPSRSPRTPGLPPGSPAVPPAGAASSPLGGSGSPGACSQDGASRHASPLPPPPGGAVGTFRFAAVEPVGRRREGEGATTSARKREEEEGEVSALRALPGQPLLAACSAASVVLRAALD